MIKIGAISYADAFAMELAIDTGGKLVTGAPKISAPSVAGPEAGQELYLFNTLPHWHFGRYRYTLFLALVDCTSFAAMRRLGIKKVFAFDRHFAEQGFEPF